MILTLLLLVSLSAPSLEQDTPASPCPRVFQYLPPKLDAGPPNLRRWYGVIRLLSYESIYSLRLNIILDRKADILGNWLGEVTTADNTNYKIVNRTLQIEPGAQTTIRFFVQYRSPKPAPKLLGIKLNGKEICNDNIPESGSTDIRPEDIFETKPERPIKDNPVNPVYQPPTPSHEQLAQIFGSEIQPSKKPTVSPAWTPSISADGNVRCGTVLMNGAPLAIGGTSTLEGQWPWQIAIYHSQLVDYKFMCGGTLVSRRYVITAAHCVTRSKSKLVVDKKTLTVHLGKTNLRTSYEGVQIAQVQDIIVHPEYNASTNSRDLGILQLRRRVEYSDWVVPACLWPDNLVDLEHIVNKKGSVVGWGIDASGIPTEELNLVEMPVVDQQTCLWSHHDFFVRFTSPYTYCAGTRDGTSVCNGDSGGGMVFNIAGFWYLRGLVSLSVRRHNENRCDPNHYVIFTDIAKYLPWIKQMMDDDDDD